MPPARSILLFLIVLLVSLDGFGKKPKVKVPKTDLLYLNNGNVVTGEIKKLDYGVLSFKTDDINTPSVNWPKVRQLKSIHTFELTLKNNDILAGSIDTADGIRELRLITDTGSLIVNMDDLVKIVPIKNTFKSRLDGHVNFGLNFSKGSQNLQYNLSAEVRYRSLHDLIVLSGNSIINRDKSQEDTVLTTRKQDAALSYTRYFRERWYLQEFFGIDQNTELGLQRRLSLALLGGKQLFQNRIHAMNTGAGFVGTQEKPVTGDITYNFESAVLIEYRIYKLTYPKVQLTTKLYAVPSLSNPGRIRLNGETDMEFEFFKDFIISFSTYQSFDNKPATEGASKYDWGITTSIGYTF